MRVPVSVLQLDGRRAREHTIHGQRGSSVVELALVTPVLVGVLVGTVDFARVFYWDMALTTAARAGAQYGARNTTNASDSPGMKTAAVNAAQVDIASLSSSDITATCALKCEPDAPADAFYTLANPSGGSACTNPTPTCTGGNHLIWTVTVSATKPFSTLARYPGIPNTLAITRSVTMRTQ
jgi:Flp pilus assembly protein TadG